mmetsp:Transcript_62594/g.173486  ORF Transcript_62594/g.173486 Transcript_62594/m.173486 type:complete len:315 (-) Transcript_62594:53-997(-)
MAARSRSPPRARAQEAQLPEGLTAFNNVDDWHQANKELFAPPICNKLMHKEQMTVMFVGGPNTREDFHLDKGSEFFYQMKGNIELVTMQRGKRKPVPIKEGQVFLCPSCIPHSPQRPEAGAFGLVIERARDEDELDGLRYFVDFKTCETVLWERFFHCADLGRDLLPVVQAWHASEEKKTRVPGANVLPNDKRPLQVNEEIAVPPPFYLKDFLLAHQEALAKGNTVPLFGTDHPDKEFTINVIGGPSEQTVQPIAWDTWLYQIKGSATITVGSTSLPVPEGSCVSVRPQTAYTAKREPGSIGMLVIQDPTGNKK